MTRLIFSKLHLPEDHGARGADHLLALISLIMNGAIGAAERYFLRWQENQNQAQVVSL